MSTTRIAIAQLAPVLLDRAATVSRAADAVLESARHGAGLVCFGETHVPAYPLWLSLTDGARFEADDQKDLHARYLDQAVTIEQGHLGPVQDAARRTGAAVVIGVAERPPDRGGHSIFCSAVTIAPDGSIASVHRKLMPTYEERLAWACGDGHGLVAHRFAQLGPFTLGSLNCWENWMPLARAAMHARGVDLHVSLWPGNERNTRDNCPFVAREGRSFVIGASSYLTPADIPRDVPSRDRIVAAVGGEHAGPMYNGGSCVAAPDGSWVVPPVTSGPQLIYADLDFQRVLRERQSFDPAGHYSRPDVLRLSVDTRRQSAAEFV